MSIPLGSVVALDHDTRAPAWVDQHMPPRGPCGLCGAVDARHRVLDAIASRIAAGEGALSVAEDYGLPVRFVGRVVRELAHEVDE